MRRLGNICCLPPRIPLTHEGVAGSCVPPSSRPKRHADRGHGDDDEHEGEAECDADQRLEVALHEVLHLLVARLRVLLVRHRAPHVALRDDLRLRRVAHRRARVAVRERLAALGEAAALELVLQRADELLLVGHGVGPQLLHLRLLEARLEDDDGEARRDEGDGEEHQEERVEECERLGARDGGADAEQGEEDDAAAEDVHGRDEVLALGAQR
mmetsp:Transcript_2917/g.9089  ORF Transcript_2917/g.9089 Transcript_2917/m.9089 type:complete len:213 (-) Transcript_2917:319-957(-)